MMNSGSESNSASDHSSCGEMTEAHMRTITTYIDFLHAY